jgi:hypothetical protein
MADPSSIPADDGGRRPSSEWLPMGRVREVEALLRSWGLGDRHASASCAWVVTEASCYLAADRRRDRPPLRAARPNWLRSVERESPGGETADERCLAAYVLAVAGVFAKATGRHPDGLVGAAERRSFDEFLIACLRLIVPLVTPDAVQAIRRRTLDRHGWHRHP